MSDPVNEWREWEKAQLEKRMAEIRESLPQQKPSHQKEPVATRPITTEELNKLRRLKKVSLARWGGSRRFVQQFENATTETEISERQAWYIEVLWYRHRRQLGHNDPKPVGYFGGSNG